MRGSLTSGVTGMRVKLVISSPSARSIPTSAKQSHRLNSAAARATILDDVVAFPVGGASLNFHCLFANKAAQQINQGAFIVIQMRFFRHPSDFTHHFPFALNPITVSGWDDRFCFTSRRCNCA
jgi:hypothetical protein